MAVLCGYKESRKNVKERVQLRLPPARTVYYAAQEKTFPELLRPHLVVYLDVPVDEVRRRVAARPPPHPTSPFHAPDVLAYMENIYKQQFLKEIRYVSNYLPPCYQLCSPSFPLVSVCTKLFANTTILFLVWFPFPSLLSTVSLLLPFHYAITNYRHSLSTLKMHLILSPSSQLCSSAVH